MLVLFPWVLFACPSLSRIPRLEGAWSLLSHREDVPRGVQVKTCLAFTAPHRGLAGLSSSREQLAGLSFGPCHLSWLLHPSPQGGTAQGEGRHPERKCGQTHPPDFKEEEVRESLKTSLGLFVLMGIYYFSPVPYHFPKCSENKISARALTM